MICNTVGRQITKRFTPDHKLHILLFNLEDFLEMFVVETVYLVETLIKYCRFNGIIFLPSSSSSSSRNDALKIYSLPHVASF